MSIASDFLVPIRDGVLDTVGFGGAGKLADEFQCKGDSAAEAVAGGDAACLLYTSDAADE